MLGKSFELITLSFINYVVNLKKGSRDSHTYKHNNAVALEHISLYKKVNFICA